MTTLQPLYIGWRYYSFWCIAVIYESSKIRRCDWSKHIEFSTVAMRITVSMYENCYAIGSKWHHENEILGEISFFVGLMNSIVNKHSIY